MASAARTSAQQFWQAGLGAFAVVQEEGSRVFSMLVKEGGNCQRRTQRMADDQVADVAGTASKVVDGMREQTSGSWGRLEQLFEDRVSRALEVIGVPTRRDMQE